VRHGIVWILLLALVIRGGLALGVHVWLQKSQRDFLVPGDAEGYWELGRRLARGESFEIYQPPRKVMRMPGFPILLAIAIRIGGEELLVARLMVLLTGVAACWLVYLLGRELADEQTALLAALLASTSPLLAGFSVLILSETTFAAALMASLLAMARLARSWGRSSRSTSELLWKPALMTGVLIALANYIRPSWMLAAPGFCVVHLWFRTRSSRRTSSGFRSAVLECLLVAVSLAVTLAPWTYRNWQITGRFIPTTLWVGPSLYDGLHPAATGESDMKFFDRENLMATMSESEMDRTYRNRAWQFARENPGRALKLSLIKLGRFWHFWPNADQFRHPTLCLAVAGFTLPVLSFAIFELLKRRPDPRFLLLTVGPVLYFSLIHSIFIGSIRYRLPAEYPLLILSAAGMLAAVNRFRVSRASHPDCGGQPC